MFRLTSSASDAESSAAAKRLAAPPHPGRALRVSNTASTSGSSIANLHNTFDGDSVAPIPPSRCSFKRAETSPAELPSLNRPMSPSADRAVAGEDEDLTRTRTSSCSSTSTGGSEKKNRRKLQRLLNALSFESAKGLARRRKYSIDKEEHHHLNEDDLGTPRRGRRPNKHSERESPVLRTTNMLRGTLDPDGGVEVVFYDAVEYGDDATGNRDAFEDKDAQRDSIVLSTIKTKTKHGGVATSAYCRGGDQSEHDESIELARKSFADDDDDDDDYDDDEMYGFYEDIAPDENELRGDEFDDEQGPGSSKSLKVRGGAFDPEGIPPPPPPPTELPLRFLRAGKGDPEEGLRRYEATLKWRRENKVDTILREPNFQFDLIKEHYPHFCHGKGKRGEPVFFEQPPKTNLKALREGGVDVDSLLRYYVMITEYQWQYLVRDDLQNSIYVIDLKGIRFGDFVGEVVDFVKKASVQSAQHYPERAGYVFVINVPSWFKVIWTVLKPLVDESTLEKIYILRGAESIRKNMEERIPMETIPSDYGGLGPPLGQSEEEKTFRELVEHNNEIATNGICPLGGPAGSPPCKFCSWVQPRSY